MKIEIEQKIITKTVATGVFTTEMTELDIRTLMVALGRLNPGEISKAMAATQPEFDSPEEAYDNVHKLYNQVRLAIAEFNRLNGR